MFGFAPEAGDDNRVRVEPDYQAREAGAPAGGPGIQVPRGHAIPLGPPGSAGHDQINRSAASDAQGGRPLVPGTASKRRRGRPRRFDEIENKAREHPRHPL